MKVKKTLSDLSPNVLDFLKELLECSKKSFVSWVKAIIKGELRRSVNRAL